MKFEDFMKKNPKRKATFVEKPGQDASPGDPTEQLETELLIIPFNYIAPAPSVEQRQKLAWARETYDAVPFSSDKKIIRNITVETNFININLVSKTLFHKYRIELGLLKGKPVKKEEVKRALIFKLLTVQHPPHDEARWISDFSTYIISTKPLYLVSGTKKTLSSSMANSFKIPHRLSPVPGENPAVMHTEFHHEGTFNKDVLLNYVKNIGNRQVPESMALYHPDDDIRILNMIPWKNINHPLFFGGGIVNKKFYPDPFSSAFPLYHYKGDRTPWYVIARGFFSSVRPGIGAQENGSLFLNVNPTTSAFFPGCNLMQWLDSRAVVDSNGNPDAETQDEIIGRRVTFSGDSLDSEGKRKQRVIMGFEGRVGNKQFIKKGTKTVVDMLKHMQDTYGQYPHYLKFNGKACCVQVGQAGKHDKFYPADQLTIVPYQPVQKILPSIFTDAMLTQAKNDPEGNKYAILAKAFGPLGLTCSSKARQPSGATPSVPLKPRTNWDSNYYENFGLRMDNRLLEMNARMLPAPTLEFKANSAIEQNKQIDGYKGSWNLSGSKFLEPGHNIKMGFIKIGEISDAEIKYFAGKLGADLTFYGYKFKKVKDSDLHYSIVNGGNGNNNREVMSTNILSACRGTVGGRGLDTDTNLLIFVLENKDISAYSNIKWWADCFQGIANICVTKAVMNKKNKSGSINSNMIANLSLKINFKLMGTTHQIRGSKKWGGAFQHTMIVGADVTHPGKNMACPSMAGVVATRGGNAFHYLASARLQPGTQEYIEGLDSMISERLEAYFEKERRHPEHILFYRDGVSESQLGMVKLRELLLIRQGCITWGKTKNESNYAPKITILVVGKRHHVRFYPTTPGHTTKDKNFQSGLVVDSVITSPYKCDFYLQSHDCPLGTARTAHYIIIQNESNCTMDALQELTNNLCFLSARATKSLSVCTPARYADILCDRLRCYMKPYLCRQDQNNPTTIDMCAQDMNTWGRNPGSDGMRQNPWKNTVNNIMFYL